MESMVMNWQTAYQGRRVFLTGHTGFKGTWMLQWLQLLGAEVKGYALAPEQDEALYHLLNGDAMCQSLIADIRDADRLKRELIDFAPDFVFHLAAQPLVRLSYEIPSETFAVNAIGTANILEAVRQLPKQCTVVIITTDKVYENKEWVYPYREKDRLGGYDPYSASKACAELITNSYAQSFFNVATLDTHGKGIASARAGNVIGGGDWARDRIIPDIVRALRQGEPVRVRNPRAVRPWQHVLEPVHGYLQLGAKLASDPARYGGGWNFGPYAEDNKEVEELVQAALRIWGSGNYDKPQLSGEPHEAGLLKLDISKAKGELGWSPRYTADEAIQHTLQWYKAYDEQPGIMQEFTINQINTFTEHDF
jgi:CDP-glucose 4,6-dehydratase